MSCRCCCNCFIFSLFLIIGVLGSLFPIFLICDSVINTIPNYDYFEHNWLNYGNKKSKTTIYYYKYYKNLKIIHEEYEKLSNQINSSGIDLITHFVILPTFVLLSFIFSNCFVCYKRDYKLYILFEIISILVKGLCLYDKILYEIKISNLASLEENIESNTKIIQIYRDYENFRKKGIFYDVVPISIIFLGLELILFIILLCVNCSTAKDNEENEEYDEENKNKKCGRRSIIFYTVFSFLSVPIYIMGNYACSNCKLKYGKYYEKDKIYDYNYKSYPILKEIYDIYINSNNYDKYSINEFKTEYFHNIFFYLFSIFILLTIITYILLICINNKQNCKGGYIVFEILSFIIKGIIIFFTTKYTMKGIKKNLENKEYKSIHFLIDDYYNYYKCKTKYTVMVIIQIIYILIEIIDMISVLACTKNTNNYINRNIIRPIEQQESEENTNQIRQRNEEPEIVANNRFNPNPNPTNIINNINIINSQPNRPNLKKIVKKIKMIFKITLFDKVKYELEANQNEIFTDVLTRFICQNKIFFDNPIKYIFTQKVMIYSDELNEENKFKTLEDLHIEDGEIINVQLEETDINKIERDDEIKKIYGEAKKEEKEKEKEKNEINNINENMQTTIKNNSSINPNMSIIPNNFNSFVYIPSFLKFVNSASDDDHPYFINIILTEKFSDVFNRLKGNNSNLNNYDFEAILLSGKKYKPKDINNKTIQELNLNSMEYIYLYGKLIENVMIELQFYWENNEKKYKLQIGKKQKFHDVIVKLYTTNIELQNHIITNLYYYPKDENENKTENYKDEDEGETKKENENENVIDNDKQNINENNENIDNKNDENKNDRSEILMLNKKTKESDTNININNIVKIKQTKDLDKIILEAENLKCDKIIENMDINEETLFYFETRENTQKIENAKRQEERNKYLQYMNSQNTGDKVLLNFKLTTGVFYFIFVDKKTKISEAMNKLRETYKTFKDVNAKKIIFNAQPLDNNETIEKYNIQSDSPILIVTV